MQLLLSHCSLKIAIAAAMTYDAEELNVLQIQKQNASG